MTTVFIVNPRSAGGATAQRVAALHARAERFFGPDHQIVLTERPGHASDLAEQVQCERLIAVGGDGTAHEVVNGLARRPEAERPIVGVLKAGTGCDLVKSLGMPVDADAAFEVLKNGEIRNVDWIRTEFGTSSEVSINVAGFGLSGAVVRAVNEGSKALGGKLSFALATACETLAWNPPVVRVSWTGPDGEGAWSGPLASTFIANASFCGGGMHVGPGGRMDDGVAELSIVPYLSPLRSLRYAKRLYDGSIASVPGVVHVPVYSVRAEAEPGVEVLIDLDGEQPGVLPVTLTVESGQLRMVGRWR